MKALFFRILVAIAAVFAAACSTTDDKADRPRLVVVIVVDQMCQHHIDRFGDLYTGGIGRLLADGAIFDSAWHDHAKTHTSPGHATIATGVVPARHGIVANAWYDRTDGFAKTYSARDSAAPVVGQPDRDGASPRRLLRETVGDWLKRQSPGSKVFSVSLKDYSAVLMGGHDADAAYWYDSDRGTYCTSTFYTDAYPAWVDAFNAAGPADSYRDAVWTRSVPEAAYDRSRGDEFVAESDGVHTTFPYAVGPTAEEREDTFYGFIRNTPFADELTLRFATAILEEERLGTDDEPDLLLVCCSAADFIGHEWGPYSQEAGDYYMRLDGYLATFFDELDRSVGRDKYTVVFTSDHGVLPLPEGLADEHAGAQRVERDRYNSDLDSAAAGLCAELGIDVQLIARRGYGLALNAEAVRETGISMAELRERMAREIVRFPYVEEAFTYDELIDESVARRDNNGEPREWGRYRLVKNSFHPDRSPDLYVVFEKYNLVTSMEYGTTHGSPHDYDRRVPLIFWGSGVEGGVVATEVRTADVAPTIARLLGIAAPADLDGRSLDAALSPSKRK